jgi:2-hydroxy-3-keto-5-methylthiopentenyl-1-phosphate phosphatase
MVLAAPDSVPAEVFEGLGQLSAGLDKLAARVQADQNANRAGRFGQPRSRPQLRTELDTLPAKGAPAALFCEFDGLCVSGDIESVLLGQVGEDRDERVAAWQRMAISQEEALTQLREAGVQLDTAFVDFVESCMISDVAVCIVSRSLKALVRMMLRDAGIGHIEVYAHDSYIEPGGVWKVCFRDNSESGHNKADSVRRARSGQANKGSLVYVGSAPCDFAPVEAAQVDHLLAVPHSPLAALCDGAGVRYREFRGWEALARELVQET